MKSLDILDLFSGEGAELRRNIIEGLGHTYRTVDLNPKFDPDIHANVLDITPEELEGRFDFIWASPDCSPWSVTQIGRNWYKYTNLPKTQKATDAIPLVKHTLELLKMAKIGWVLENPMGKLRKMDFMQEYKRNTVTYCQYGEDRMKPTDLWYSGFDWVSRPMCKNGDSCHVSAPRGSKTGTQGYGTYAKKSIVPTELWLEILEYVSK
jgi:hypothetical protein